MRKIRQGNDFTFVWAVSRNGVPEDFGRATDIRLALRSRYGTTVISNHRVQNGVITIDFTPEMLASTERTTCVAYNIQLTYKVPDTSLADGVRECTVDVDAFTIVPRTAQADEVTQIAVTSEAFNAIKGERGEKGERGAPLTYTDLTDEQKQELRGSNLLAEYVHSGNREVRIERIDYDTNTFYSPNHGLVEGDRLVTNFAGVVNIGQVCPLTASANKIHGYTAVGVTSDSFKVSVNGVVVKLQSRDTIDLSKWWFEYSSAPSPIKINIPQGTRDLTVRYLGYGCGIYYYHTINGLNMYERGILYSNNSISWYQSHSLPYTPTSLIDSTIRITIGAFHVEQEICNNFALKQDVGIYSVKTERVSYRPLSGKTDGIKSLLLASPSITGAFIANGTTIRIYKND